jgi:hypothetical protein
VESLGSIARVPEECRSRKLVSRGVLRVARLNDLFDDPGKPQLIQALANDNFRV